MPESLKEKPMLVLVKIFTWLASPMGLFVFLGLLGWVMVFATKWKTLGKALVTLGTAQIIVFSSPIVADQLLGGLEKQARDLGLKNQQPAKILSAEKYRAIVLLGGATAPASPPNRPQADLNDAADRIFYAARLYKQGIAPTIIVTGGKSPGLESRPEIQTEAQAMRQFLLELGVPDGAIVIEEQSRNTRENAAKTKTYIGEGRVALVTSASHMPRSMATFANAGVNADAYPTDFRVAPEVAALWSRMLPTGGSLERSEAALKEYLALLIRY